MKIGFLISGVGIFGSVREIVENGNVFVKLGHDVTIYNPEKESIDWIRFDGKVKHESKLQNDKLDVLILTTSATNHYLELFKTAKADMKIYCFMGFDEKLNIFEGNENLQYIVDNYYLTADGMWQIDYLKQNTDSKKIIEAQIGGINTEMFRPLEQKNRKKLNIGWSGDSRKRKGGSTLIKFFEENKINTVTYFGKGIPQSEMSNWFNGIDIFIDNHYSGGWCNPVAEAMACGVPVICSNVQCNSNFTTNWHTALKFEFNDFIMLKNHLDWLINHKDTRHQLAFNGLNEIKKFDYNKIAPKFLAKILEIA